MPESAPLRRFTALDGLRGIAVILVLVMHYYVAVPTLEGGAWHDGLKRAFSLSFCGVDLFFVLSGLLIGGILLDFRDSPQLVPTFYRRRFFRIVPIYAVLLASFFIFWRLPELSAIGNGAYFESSVPAWTYFGMLQNVAMSSARNVGSYWLGPTWSLAVEEQFYLFMPFLVRHLSRRALAYVCVVAFVLCPLLRVTALLHGENLLAAVFLLPMRAEGLLGGVLCAIALRDARILDVLRAHCRLIGWLIAALGAFLALFCSLNLRAGSALMASFGYSIVSLFFVGVVLWVMLFPEGKAARALSLKPLCAMGLISYFVYLFHNPTLFTLHGLIRHQPAMHFDGMGAGVTLLALALTVVLGGLSWRLFESPLVKLGRQRGYR